MTTTTVPDTQKQSRTHSFTKTERVLAGLLILWGYGFFRLCPIYDHPYPALALLCVLFGMTLLVLRKNGHKLIGMSLASALSALPISLSLLVPADHMIHSLAFLYALVAFAYTVYAACGNTLEQGTNPRPSELLPIDVLKAVFFLPFSSLGSLFHALSLGDGAFRKVGKFVGRIFAGLLLALLPTFVVLGLLSYDDRFLAQVGDVLEFLLRLDNVGSHLLDLGLGVVFATYLFGLYTAAVEKRLPEMITAEGCHKTANALHRFSPVTTVSATVPVLVLYGIFFFTQWEDYISAFLGTLPEDMVYAEYAREGFFELCWVSAINLCLLIITGMSTQKKEDKPHPALRILHVVLSVCTLCLIATAMAKLGLYMYVYGLTEKRVYAAWFMLVLTLLFVLVIVKQIRPKLKVVVWSVAVCVGMFALLSLSNVPGIVEWYNMGK